MSSIIRRRRGLKSAISILLSEGWAPTPTSSQPGGDLRHLAPYAAAAASFNPLPHTRFPANSIASACRFQILNQRLGNSSRTTRSATLLRWCGSFPTRRLVGLLAVVMFVGLAFG